MFWRIISNTIYIWVADCGMIHRIADYYYYVEEFLVFRKYQLPMGKSGFPFTDDFFFPPQLKVENWVFWKIVLFSVWNFDTKEDGNRCVSGTGRVLNRGRFVEWLHHQLTQIAMHNPSLWIRSLFWWNRNVSVFKRAVSPLHFEEKTKCFFFFKEPVEKSQLLVSKMEFVISKISTSQVASSNKWNVLAAGWVQPSLPLLSPYRKLHFVFVEMWNATHTRARSIQKRISVPWSVSC